MLVHGNDLKTDREIDNFKYKQMILRENAINYELNNQ